MQLKEAKRMIGQAIDGNRLSHAYLLAGAPRGVAGELAVYIMRRLACLDPEQAPCGVCDRCRQVAEHTWCNNIWIYPVKKSRSISIEQMRETSGSKIPPPYFLPWLSETAFAGGWKVGVLVGADRMTEGAANAFLKMLEEPPAMTLMLLLTDAPEALLPTIRSRCQMLVLDEPPAELDEPWRSEVLEVLATDGTHGPVAAMAAGMRLMRVLQSMKECAADLVAAEIAAQQSDEQEGEGGETGRDAVSESRSDDSKVEQGQDVLEARVSARYRELRALLLLALQRWYRDLLVLRANAPASVVHYHTHLEVLQQRASRLTLAQALANVEGLETLTRQMERSLAERSLLLYWMDRLVSGAA